MGSQTTQGPTEPLYTLAEVGEPLRLSAATMRRRVDVGELDAFRVGRGWRVTESARDEFYARIGFLPAATA